jgi:predicted anti-sigma-YlaC factor YlaD
MSSLGYIVRDGNPTATSCDHVDMDCEPFVEAISALADGEPSPIDQRLVDAHIAQCPSCQRFDAAMSVSDRSVIHVGRSAHHVSRLASAAQRVARWQTTRVLLAVVAIQLVILSGRDLLWPVATGTAIHDVRHLAAFTVAYGMILVAVAIRPTRARSALPAAAVLAGALAITAMVDLIAGRIPLAGEITHLPEVLSVVLIRILAPPEHPGGVLRRLPGRVARAGDDRQAG